MGRAPCCEKIGLRKGRWTREEDEILTKYIQAHGEGSWRSLPKNAGLLRCGKSCRLRWINYLRADLKRGNITPEEQQIILQLYSTLGSRWSLIAGHLPGRTDNEIKNYWNSHVSKRICGLTKATMGSDQPTTTATSAAITVGASNTVTAIVTTNKKRKGRMSSSGMKKDTLMSSSLKRSDNSTCPERDDEDGDGAQRDNLITGQTESLPVIKDHVESTEIHGSDVDKVEEADKLLELGPYEWLDSEMMGLNEFLLQDERADFDKGMGILNHGTLMETDKAVVTASDEESNGEWYNNSSSSNNNNNNNNNSSSSSVNDWFDWDWMMRNDEEASDNNSSLKDSQFMFM